MINSMTLVRARQRYIDLMMIGVKDTFFETCHHLQTIRAVFGEAGYTEVETPSFANYSGRYQRTSVYYSFQCAQH